MDYNESIDSRPPSPGPNQEVYGMSVIISPLRRSLVAKDVLSSLRYEIITGQYQRGDYLKELAISKKMNISRGPVRSAFQQLEAEGLVESEENGWTRVVGITEKDIDDIYELRLMLEKKAVADMQHLEFVDYRPLLDVLSSMKAENDRGAAADPILMASMGHEVHVAMMRCCGNRAVYNAWKSLSNILHSIMEINGDYVDAARAYESHKLLVDAIIQKRPDCESIIEQHLLQNSKDIYLDALKNVSQNREGHNVEKP